MASLFEQYERSLSSRPIVDESNPNSSIINICSDSEEPIFSKYKIDFSPPENITHLVVSNNHVVMALKNKNILRIDLMHPNQPIEIDLNQYFSNKSNSLRINALFLDPTAKHCIINAISTESQSISENFYLSKKVVPTSKMKGHVISAIAWNHRTDRSGSNTTSNILIGTTKGLIFETELVSSDESKFFAIGGPEQFWKQANDLGPDSGPVFAIAFHKISSTEDLYFVIYATKNRLYQLVGNASNSNDSPFLYQIFNTNNIQLKDMPGNMSYSKLDFYFPVSSATPVSFGWLTEPGVFWGKIDFNSRTASIDDLITDANILYYRKESDKYLTNENPISLVLTQFHVLVLMKTHLKVICVLNQQIVFEDFFTETYGKLVGIAKDPIKGTVWVFTQLAVYRYKIVGEDRNIWKIYLAKGDFEAAKRLAKNDPIKTDHVISAEADYYFSNKNYEKSASLYALSHKSFEEIALKFIQIKEEEALKQFLVCKADTLSEKDTTQLTILLLWLIEIELNQMSSLKHSTQEYQTIEAEFKGLIQQNKFEKCLKKSKKSIYNLIESYGNQNNLIDFAFLMHDFERVIEFYIQRKDFGKALEVLRQQAVPDMFYRFAPIIIQEMPAELISVLIQFATHLDSTKLIPALVQQHIYRDNEWHQKQCLETIRYLEYCAFKLRETDPVIHNYLLALYAQTEPDKLLTYLSMKGQDESTVPYDIRYAVRICMEFGLERACVHLYSTMAMFEEAIDLALSFDVQLAKQTAEKPELSDELRKKLWLRIAKHVIKEQQEIKIATQILKECQLLKIEDILPFFPDFVTIDHFKEAICSSLQEYNQNIEALKEDMKSATESARQIRQEIKEFRNKFTIIRTEDKCVVCSYAVLTRWFYSFPCGHLFHSDCLIEEVIPYLKQTQQNRVEEIRRNLSVGSSLPQIKTSNDVFADQSNSIAVANERERLLTELDDIVANECFYCGDVIIDCIDEPFIRPEEMSLVMEGWD